MMYYNKETKQVQSNPPWGNNKISDSLKSKKFSNWEEVSNDFILTLEEPLESKKANLEAKYNETISNLKDSMVTAILQDDSQTQSELKEEYIQVVNDYENQLKDLKENK